MGDPKSHDIDMAGESTGQGYLSASATRAIIYIEADNPAIGLMAFIGIGMTEVSLSRSRYLIRKRLTHPHRSRHAI